VTSSRINLPALVALQLTLGILWNVGVAFPQPSLPGQQTPIQNSPQWTNDPFHHKSIPDAPDQILRTAPDAEVRAAKKVEAASGPAAKIEAASEFIKKYPKSSLRRAVAQRVVVEVRLAADAAKKVSYAEASAELFRDSSERVLLDRLLLEAYVGSKRFEDAFKRAGALLETNPNALDILVPMTIVGAEQATRGNLTFSQASLKYGTTAISLIESDTKAAALGQTEVQLKEYKEYWLPLVYQSLGGLAFASGDDDEAKARLRKSIALNPSEPQAYLLMASIADSEYQHFAKEYKSARAGTQQDELLKKALATMDAAIDYYAHAVALFGNNQAYKQIAQNVQSDLTKYYLYRHNNSTDGLKELIDRYKAQARH
jgi:tetratricopeptide (TPR) repeat protein